MAVASGLDNDCGDTIRNIRVCERSGRGNGGVRIFGSLTASKVRALVTRGVGSLTSNNVPFRRIISTIRSCYGGNYKLCFYLRDLSTLGNGNELFGLTTGIVRTLHIGLVYHHANRNGVSITNGSLARGHTLAGLTGLVTGSARNYSLTNGGYVVDRIYYRRGTRDVGSALRDIAKCTTSSVVILGTDNLGSLCTSGNKVVISFRGWMRGGGPRIRHLKILLFCLPGGPRQKTRQRYTSGFHSCVQLPYHGSWATHLTQLQSSFYVRTLFS